MEVIYDQFIGTYLNVIPPELCSKIIEVFERPDTKTVHRSDEDYGDKVPPLRSFKDDIRIHISDFPGGWELAKKLSLTFSECLEDYIKRNDTLKLYHNGDKMRFTGFMLQKTEPGGGYHIWHAECDGSLNTLYRVAVWTLYLNDITEGGETEFLHQHKRISPKTGTLCIFPSYYTHVHRGNPPLKDSKYIMTGWIELPPIEPDNNE